MKSESSKWLPVGISCLALVISFLSWRDSRRVNTAVNRPFLKFEIIKPAGGCGPECVHLTTKIMNTGKSSATIMQARHTVVSLEDKCRLEKPPYKLEETSYLPFRET
jgi:hypothetical protein